MRRSAALVAVLVLTLTTTVTACSSADPSEITTYVAIGDSYTSGAGMPDPAPTRVCEQSELAYPRLVAAALDAELVDASCGGAETADVTRPQPRPDAESWPAQLDRLDRGTDLVTVGLGYNDLGFLAGLLSCAEPCAENSADLLELPTRIGERVDEVLRAVRAAAPDATVLVVGYPQLAPADGPCAAYPASAADHAFVRTALARLDGSLRDAARSAGATYVEVLAASEGHDACAGEDAWLSGADPVPDQRAPFHPNPAGHAAVADLVLRALG